MAVNSKSTAVIELQGKDNVTPAAKAAGKSLDELDKKASKSAEKQIKISQKSAREQAKVQRYLEKTFKTGSKKNPPVADRYGAKAQGSRYRVGTQIRKAGSKGYERFWNNALRNQQRDKVAEQVNKLQTAVANSEKDYLRRLRNRLLVAQQQRRNLQRAATGDTSRARYRRATMGTSPVSSAVNSFRAKVIARRTGKTVAPTREENIARIRSRSNYLRESVGGQYRQAYSDWWNRALAEREAAQAKRGSIWSSLSSPVKEAGSGVKGFFSAIREAWGESPLSGAASKLGTALSSLASKFLGAVGVFNTLMAAASFLKNALMALANFSMQYLSISQKAFELRDSYATDINRGMAMSGGDYDKAYAITDKAYEHAIATRMDSSDYMNTLSRFSMSYSGWADEDSAYVFTDTVAKALATGGATSTEVGSVMTQLSQAFNKGNLNGDELRSISENSFILRDAIQKQVVEKLGTMAEAGEITKAEYEEYKEMGITDLGASGLIKASDIVDAVLGKTDVINELFDKSAWTTDQMRTVFGTMVKQQFAKSGMNEAMTEVYKQLLAAMPTLSDAIGKAFKTITDRGLISDLADRITNFVEDIAENPQQYIDAAANSIEMLGKFFDILMQFIQWVVDKVGGLGWFNDPSVDPNNNVITQMGDRWESGESLKGGEKSSYVSSAQSEMDDVGVAYPTGSEITAEATSAATEATTIISTEMSGATVQATQSGYDAAMAFINGFRMGSMGAGTAAETATASAEQAIEEVETTSEEASGTASGNLSGVAGEAHSWGYDMAINFASGLRDGIPEVEAAAGEVAAAPIPFLEHTVPEKGPLHDDDKWGGHLVDNFADGIVGNADRIDKASKYLASKTDDSMRESLAENMRNSLTNSWYRNLNNQTFTTNVKFGDVRETADVNQLLTAIENIVEDSMGSAVVS